MNKKSIAGYSGHFRRPEYTGKNRCLPCTVANLALAAVLAGTVAMLSVPAGLICAGIAVTVVYLRGYLIPGTPELTKRYLPGRVLAAFDKNEATRLTTGAVDPGVVLVAMGVLADSPESTDASLEPAFADSLRVRTRDLRQASDESRRREIASVFDLSASDITIVPAGNGRAVLLGDERLGTWESPAALDSDLAAMALLGEQNDLWTQLGVADRGDVAGALRLFVETCPDCDGVIALDEVTVESCCSSQRVVAAACEDCGTRMLELGMSAEELATAADP